MNSKEIGRSKFHLLSFLLVSLEETNSKPASKGECAELQLQCHKAIVDLEPRDSNKISGLFVTVSNIILTITTGVFNLFINLLIILFLVVLGLCCCLWAFL